MLLYYITDRSQLPGDEPARRQGLLARIAEAASAGVDYLQLREKDLPIIDLERIAREAAGLVQEARRHGSPTRLLVNSRSDVALACGADGVHLTANDLFAAEVRALWMKIRGTPPVIGVSCHSVAEVRMAESQGADFAVLAPIFGKEATGAAAIGVEALRHAQRGDFPVLALGGVTWENAGACVEAGAAGVAGIRIFQQQPISAAMLQEFKLR